MKRKCLNVGLMVLGLALATSSCKKKEEEKPATVVVTPAPAPVPVTVQGFIWSENGSTTTQKAVTAYFTARYNTLIATNASGTIIEINLTAGTAATYTIGGTNALTYLPSGSTLVASSGNVVISANANSKMTGTFSVSFTSGSITSVNGTFTDIEVK